MKKNEFIQQLNLLSEQWLNRDLPEYADETTMMKLAYITLCGRMTHMIGANMNATSRLSSLTKEVDNA